MVGSMSPDMAYVLFGSRFEVWAHAMPWLVLFCVPITMAVTVLTVRWLAPVVPDHLPQLGSFRLHDYRGLATHRFRLLPLVLGSVLGAVSHVGLDHLTHEWGWPAANIGWYKQVVFQGEWAGRQWTAFRVVQYVGHIGLSLVGVWLLLRYGRQEWMKRRAEEIPRFETTRGSHLALWGTTAAATAVGALWVATDPSNIAAVVMRLVTAVFVGMCVGSVLLRSIKVERVG